MNQQFTETRCLTNNNLQMAMYNVQRLNNRVKHSTLLYSHLTNKSFRIDKYKYIDKILNHLAFHRIWHEEHF